MVYSPKALQGWGRYLAAFAEERGRVKPAGCGGRALAVGKVGSAGWGIATDHRSGALTFRVGFRDCLFTSAF